MFISLYRETRNIGPEGRQRIAPGAKVCTVIEAYPLASLKGCDESAQQPKPWVMREFRISPERAKQTICVALSGLYQNYFSTQSGRRPGCPEHLPQNRTCAVRIRLLGMTGYNPRHRPVYDLIVPSGSFICTGALMAAQIFRKRSHSDTNPRSAKYALRSPRSTAGE